MFEIRIHGRGGQGVVSAAEMLAVAAFEDGRHSQAFPTFGSERTGSPVVSFCRIDDEPIRIHEPIVRPDALIVEDATLIHQVRLFEGVEPRSYLLVNTSRAFADLGLEEVEERLRPGHAICLPATELARDVLARPLPNTALLGAFAALTGIVSLPSVVSAIRQTFSGTVADANVRLAQTSYDRVLVRAGEPGGESPGRLRRR